MSIPANKYVDSVYTLSLPPPRFESVASSRGPKGRLKLSNEEVQGTAPNSPGKRSKGPLQTLNSHFHNLNGNKEILGSASQTEDKYMYTPTLNSRYRIFPPSLSNTLTIVSFLVNRNMTIAWVWLVASLSRLFFLSSTSTPNTLLDLHFWGHGFILKKQSKQLTMTISKWTLSTDINISHYYAVVARVHTYLHDYNTLAYALMTKNTTLMNRDIITHVTYEKKVLHAKTKHISKRLAVLHSLISNHERN